MTALARYLLPDDIRSVAVIGTGSVGASWAALFLAHGMRVIAHDPAPGAQSRVRSFIDHAWPALRELRIAQVDAAPFDSMLSFVDSPAQAARMSDVIQENIPEKPALKAPVLAELARAATPDKIILSSTGGISPTTLQSSCRHPERLVVVHPFNPAHLIPLVEVVGGRHTAAEVVDWAMAFARRVGKQPIRLNMETRGHLANRLQFALVREAVACLVDGIATAQDIDAAVRYGLGPRWMLLGSLLTLHLAGGRGGMQGILEHAGDAIEEWWTPRSQPRLTAEVKSRLAAAAEELVRGRDIDEWVRWRDAQLVEVTKLQNQSASTAPGAPAKEGGA
jgi:carnitine 3-dehydrogenase